jgi:hypothetical protein
MQTSLASFTVLRRWQAMASMLMIDPMRTGDVLAIAPLRGWVYSHLKRDLFGELEVRFRIACSGWLDTLPALFRSHDFQTGTHLVIDVMRTLPYADACVFRDRILQGVERYPGPPVGEAVARVLEAFPP